MISKIWVRLAVILLAFVGVAEAAVIEQNKGASYYALGNFDPIGQSFIAQDPILQSIAFMFSDLNSMAPNLPVTVSLYEGAGFGGTLVKSISLQLPHSLPKPGEPRVFYDFDFGGTVLTVGKTYTAAATTGLSSKIGIGVAEHFDAYTDGQMFITNTSCTWTCDLNFRVTPSAVPLPSTMWLLSSGFAALGLAARRKAP